MTALSQVIASAVNKNMCTWSSLRTHKYASDILTMSWGNEGFLVPELIGTYDNDSACISVCPFSQVPLEPVKDETALTEIFLTGGTLIHEKFGRLIGIYAAYTMNTLRSHPLVGLQPMYSIRCMIKGSLTIFFIVSINYLAEAGLTVDDFFDR